MASNRDFVIKMSNKSSNRVISYEGTSGEVPWPLQGEFTSPALAKRALEKYLAEVKPESKQEIKVEEFEPAGEKRGPANRKQRI